MAYGISANVEVPKLTSNICRRLVKDGGMDALEVINFHWLFYQYWIQFS